MAQCGCIARGIVSDADGEHRGLRCRLRERHVYTAVPAKFSQVLVCVTHNADDFCWCLVDASDKEMLADGVFSGGIIWPEMAGQVFVNDGDPLLTLPIAFRKCAAPFPAGCARLESNRA